MYYVFTASMIDEIRWFQDYCGNVVVAEKMRHNCDSIEIMRESLVEYSVDNPEKEIPVSDGLVTRETEVGLLALVKQT